MTPVINFIGSPLPAKFNRQVSRNVSSRPCFLATASTSEAIKCPDAGLIATRGVTGTLCANLWPIPILGGYSWFLNVYDRDLAAATGPFVVTNTDGRLHMQFLPGEKPQSSDSSQTHRAFPGIATGNINVRKAVEAMKGADYKVMFFEKGGSQLFTKRRNEVHVVPSSESISDTLSDIWSEPAPTYRTIARASNHEVRELYPGGGASPRSTSSLEYFGMNLFPIFPFTKYSCFVCVWKQRDGLSPVAIDKRGKSLRLSFFDPLEIAEQTDDSLPSIARFAVKVFFGAVTDDTAATQHKMLLQSVESSPSVRALSKTDFRLVVDNTPGTVTPNRRNEIWVPVE